MPVQAKHGGADGLLDVLAQPPAQDPPQTTAVIITSNNVDAIVSFQTVSRSNHFLILGVLIFSPPH